jgi:hypothetical protein
VEHAAAFGDDVGLSPATETSLTTLAARKHRRHVPGPPPARRSGIRSHKAQVLQTSSTPYLDGVRGIKHRADTGVLVTFQTGSSGEYAALVELDPAASEPGISRLLHG